MTPKMVRLNRFASPKPCRRLFSVSHRCEQEGPNSPDGYQIIIEDILRLDPRISVFQGEIVFSGP